MIFTVTRSSLHSLHHANYRPCDEAVFDGKKWTIDISSIEELVSFEDKYGSFIVSNDFEPGLLEIEIYDDYVE